MSFKLPSSVNIRYSVDIHSKCYAYALCELRRLLEQLGLVTLLQL